MSTDTPSTAWQRLFSDHPASVRESYREHFYAAGNMGLRLVAMGCACLCHAFVPGLFEDTASRGVAELADRMSRRRHR